MKLDNDFFNEENEIEKIIRDYWIMMGSYSVNKDRSVDVQGSVKFVENMNFFKQLPLTFNKVSGDFDCSKLNLTTLKGSPVEVGGDFDCSYNQLTSLDYAPKKVDGCFIFDNTVKSIFTGGINSNFEKVRLFFRTNNPKLIGLSNKITENTIYLSTIFKYQNYYEVWDDKSFDDKSFNEQKFDELMEDILDGLE